MILVSAQDSELQSLSSDMQIDDDLNHEKPKYHNKKYVFFFFIRGDPFII